MKIVVAGSGRIGQYLITSLVDEGHDVVVIDNSAEVISEITSVCDVMGVCGHAADYETLESAGVKQAELYIAVTTSDETNMLSCFFAKRLGVHYAIARIRDPEISDESLSFMRKELGIDMVINPEALAARELFNILKMPSAAKIESFSGRLLEIVELRIKDGSSLDGLTLKDLRIKHNARVLICTVQRGNEVYIPGGDFVLHAGDKIGITSTPAEIELFLKKFGLMQKKAKNIMILGGGRTAIYLSKMLIAGGSSVKIIEINSEKAEELSEALPKATILVGRGTQKSMLVEEGLGETDAFVALTNQEERNILMAMFADNLNVPKVIADVDQTEMVDMAGKLGLDTIVSPKKVVTDVIIRYARGLNNSLGTNVETLYKLMDDRIEALEFRVKQPIQNVTGIKLKDLKSKQGILIAGIIRGKKTVVPGGEDMIQQGDRVVVLAKGHRLNDLTDIISVK